MFLSLSKKYTYNLKTMLKKIIFLASLKLFKKQEYNYFLIGRSDLKCQINSFTLNMCATGHNIRSRHVVSKR